jgi:hypothetical protein
MKSGIEHNGTNLPFLSLHILMMEWRKRLISFYSTQIGGEEKCGISHRLRKNLFLPFYPIPSILNNPKSGTFNYFNPFPSINPNIAQ